MATATAKFYVDGTELAPYHIQVEQRSDWHHRFEVTVSAEKAKVMDGAIKAYESIVIDNAIAYAGKSAEITIKRSGGTFIFKGEITDVHVDQTYAGDAFIIFKGFSPTFLLEGQKSVASFEEKNLQGIFDEIMSGFPANVKKEVKPKYTDPIPYIVRYNETQYQFLSRLAAIYGEWFYYDGQKIVFGDLPSSNPKVKLTFGSDSMLSFNYGINLRPSSFKQQFYKYEDNGMVEQSVAGFQPGWLDPHSKTSLRASKQLFQEEGVHPVIHRISDSNHISYLAEARKSSIVGDVMLFTGQSADPGITVGAEVEVHSKKGFIGKYRVISATHTFTSNRDYYNMFRAIPVTTTFPPSNRGVVMPEAEPQVAEVVENNDPDKLGRVRVKFKWQEGMTPWIRVITNYAGPGQSEGVTGTYFVPEIGDEVFVEFEQGNPARPYVVGSNYHGSIAPDFADPDNNLKAIKTRSGHILQFDDTDGDESILITDKKDNLIKITTKESNIFITGNNNVQVNAGNDVLVEAGKNVNVNAGDSISLKAKNTITLSAKDINVLASKGINLVAGKGLNVSAENKTESIKKDVYFNAKNVTNTIEEDLRSSAKNIQKIAEKSLTAKSKDEVVLSAKNKLDQRAGKMDIQSQKGKIKMKASGNVEIKGSQVKTN